MIARGEGEVDVSQHVVAGEHADLDRGRLEVAHDRAHLVDLGLVTPLSSAMTLTTHGTEYYRDPEMVRLAMQGVKVHEVGGVKFDVYSAGAVLYSMIENSPLEVLALLG